jgi:H+/Cl- antiporter ClcA
MRDVEPDFWHNLREELAAGRQWVDRSMVLGYAALTGPVVVGFTLLAEAANHGLEALRGTHAWAPRLMLAWTPLLTVAMLWCTRRLLPGAMGSGIPQVVRALDDELNQDDLSYVVSLRVSLHTFGLVAARLLAGLLIGREGPTVQVGAGVMVHARRWLSERSGIDSHDLMVASMRGLPDRFSRGRASHPLRFAAGCAFAVAVIGLVTGGTSVGAGYMPTRSLLEGQAELTRVVQEAAISLIALCKVGFLAATTQGLITAFTIVMEMVSGHAMMLSLMACALLASGVARLITRPMYPELSALLLPASAPPAAATAATTDGRSP